MNTAKGFDRRPLLAGPVRGARDQRCGRCARAAAPPVGGTHLLRLQAWVTRIAEEFGNAVTVRDVGPVDPQRRPPVRMAVFRRVTA